MYMQVLALPYSVYHIVVPYLAKKSSLTRGGGLKCIDRTKNTLEYAEIPTVNKTDNKALVMNQTDKWKALQSLTRSF